MKNLKKTKDIYRLGKTSYLDIAQAMDFINEYTIECYCEYIDKKADPYDIQDLLYKKNKNLNSVVFQFAIDIMTHKGFIATESMDGEPDSIKNFLYTKKGINLFFKGGLKREIIKKRRQKWLLITGQISIILAGLYYLVELLAIIFPRLFC
jgi:hypothetical protein